MCATNAAIYTIVKAWPLRLRVDIPESAVSMVRVGTALQFTTEAVPGAEFRAVVRELNPSLENRSRTLTAEARMVAQDARLKPGSFVQVKLVTNAAFPVVAVPSEAVYTVAGLNKFFTVENGKAVEHKIPADSEQKTAGWRCLKAWCRPAPRWLFRACRCCPTARK